MVVIFFWSNFLREGFTLKSPIKNNLPTIIINPISKLLIYLFLILDLSNVIKSIEDINNKYLKIVNKIILFPAIIIEKITRYFFQNIFEKSKLTLKNKDIEITVLKYNSIHEIDKLYLEQSVILIDGEYSIQEKNLAFSKIKRNLKIRLVYNHKQKRFFTRFVSYTETLAII